ncbi:MAG TPA: MurR/RpiR family transcriptional regulator [Desulfobacteraceae bacterium]|nr:MurR/RpiR family transcriptional regulator [Desulfobacteraceae bacterium]
MLGKLLIDRLRSMRKVTPSEAKIADFFVREQRRIAFESVTSIGEKCGVSKATVARFISRLGYQSFNDFQEMVQNELLERLQSPIERYSQRKAPGKRSDYLECCLSNAVKNLEEARGGISTTLFQEAAGLLARAPGAVYVLGMLISAGVAYSFWIMANYLRPNVHLLDNRSSTLPNQLINVGSEDVLLAVCNRRYSRQAASAMEHFSRRGSRIVLITDSELSPVSHLADKVLVVPKTGLFLFDSNCAALVAVEALVEAMAEKLEKSIFERLELMDRIFKGFGSFVPGPDYPLSGRVPSKSRKT